LLTSHVPKTQVLGTQDLIPFTQQNSETTDFYYNCYVQKLTCKLIINWYCLYVALVLQF